MIPSSFPVGSALSAEQEDTPMKVYEAAAIRNVALVGHGGSGKTQLTAALLFGAGAVNRLGRVDDGSTVTDCDDEEIARHHTLSSHLAHAEWLKVKVNVIDTPGFANFLSDARGALWVTEAALRRRCELEAAAHSVSGDHHHAHRGARAPQEADGWSWSVRRLPDPRRAAAPRKRLPVRG
ncbi:MAG: hypothetical protein EXQ59_02215 [Acidobacteria bacterium]|nr:hypothetical protein [Acidobacteriota bacterium]